MVTYPRVEIPAKVKLAVFERAGGPDRVTCEGACQLPLAGKRFEYHHAKGEWLQTTPPSQRPPITPGDVLLLCISCHAEITGADAGKRAKGVRIVKIAARIKPESKRGFSKKFKQKMDGSIVNKETGEVIRGPWKR